MLVEKSLKEALNKHIAGKEVLVMSTGTTDGTGSIMVDKLEDYFEGCRFLVEVPAVENEEFTQAVQGMLGKNPSDYKTQCASTDETPPPTNNTGSRGVYSGK